MLIAKRNAMSGKKLPYARRLAYLESKGSQYLVVKVRATSGFEADIDYTMMNMYVSYSCVFGGGDGNLRNEVMFSNQYTGQLIARWGASQLYPTVDVGFGAKHNLKFKLGKVYVDDKLVINYTNVISAFRANADSIGVFASIRNGKDAPTFMSQNRIYRAKIWNGEESVSLIPVMSYEGNPEMYDEVSGTFVERHGNFLYGELDGGGYKCIRSRFSRSYGRFRASHTRLWKEAA